MSKQMIAGYRYGKAPEGGRSYNTRDNFYEAGVSMASVAGLDECRSFATMAARETRKRYYYVGIICGTGSDDEYLLSGVRQIKATEYKQIIKNAANTEFYAKVADEKAVDLAKHQYRAAKILVEDADLLDWQFAARNNNPRSYYENILNKF